MATAPRKPHRNLVKVYGLRTGEPGATIVELGSEKTTYEHVNAMRSLYQGGMRTPGGHLVNVYVRIGERKPTAPEQGWQLFEKLDFAKEARR